MICQMRLKTPQQAHYWGGSLEEDRALRTRFKQLPRDSKKPYPKKHPKHTETKDSSCGVKRGYEMGARTGIQGAARRKGEWGWGFSDYAGTGRQEGGVKLKCKKKKLQKTQNTYEIKKKDKKKTVEQSRPLITKAGEENEQRGDGGRVRTKGGAPPYKVPKDKKVLRK